MKTIDSRFSLIVPKISVFDFLGIITMAARGHHFGSLCTHISEKGMHVAQCNYTPINLGKKFFPQSKLIYFPHNVPQSLEHLLQEIRAVFPGLSFQRIYLEFSHDAESDFSMTVRAE